MNSLEDVIERLKESLSMIWSRIEESSTFNTLREKFEILSASQQKAVIAGGISFVVFIIVSIPLSSLIASSTFVSEFDQKRDVVDRLLNAEQLIKQKPPLPPGLDSQQLQSAVRNKLQFSRLIEGQGPQLSPLNNNPAGALAPAILKQTGVMVKLFGLNLEQSVDIGTRLDAIHPSVKMIGLDIVSSTKFPKYYDVTFELASFSFPEVASNDKKTPEKKSPRRRGK